MAEAAENFEDFHFPLPEPSNLSEMIELRMFQMKLNKSKAAQVLGVANSKFSQIMNGKRKPDIAFLKSAHKKLRLTQNFYWRTCDTNKKNREQCPGSCIKVTVKYRFYILRLLSLLFLLHCLNCWQLFHFHFVQC